MLFQTGHYPDFIAVYPVGNQTCAFTKAHKGEAFPGEGEQTLSTTIHPRMHKMSVPLWPSCVGTEHEPVQAVDDLRCSNLEPTLLQKWQVRASGAHRHATTDRKPHTTQKHEFCYKNAQWGRRERDGERGNGFDAGGGWTHQESVPFFHSPCGTSSAVQPFSISCGILSVFVPACSGMR